MSRFFYYLAISSMFNTEQINFFSLLIGFHVIWISVLFHFNIIGLLVVGRIRNKYVGRYTKPRMNLFFIIWNCINEL